MSISVCICDACVARKKKSIWLNFSPFSNRFFWNESMLWLRRDSRYKVKVIWYRSLLPEPSVEPPHSQFVHFIRLADILWTHSCGLIHEHRCLLSCPSDTVWFFGLINHLVQSLRHKIAGRKQVMKCFWICIPESFHRRLDFSLPLLFVLRGEMSAILAVTHNKCPSSLLHIAPSST